MRNTTGSSTHAFARLSRIALALAVLAGGLTCAWTSAQNTPATAPAVAAPAAPSSTAPATPVAPAIAAPASQAPAKAASKATAKKPDNKLAWANLSAPQQQALEPLSGEWAKMSDLQKEKWLVIGKKYAKMKPEEQQRLHDRMRDWVKLTPAQRSAARTNYARAKKLDAEEKHEQWNKYQQLSAEQKKKLAQAKLPKRVAKLPSTPGGAAPTIQLPAEALDRPLVPAPVAAPPLAPGSQAAPQPATMPVAPAPAAVASGAITPVSTTIAESK
ncbi:MAG: hypothetical protein GAK35_01405 [Herbaspirillum frisingense]|uniref:DUF3106 domain-containing protein n=1 Tax=Herbaspirillum frisingense TaxID=92645 RepID=A0A7V8FY07_9BURK|nr:MAG: hypothetical protein GAK35_01405 [Herbaspirillum frisingense]